MRPESDVGRSPTQCYVLGSSSWFVEEYLEMRCEFMKRLPLALSETEFSNFFWGLFECATLIEITIIGFMSVDHDLGT